MYSTYMNLEMNINKITVKNIVILILNFISMVFQYPLKKIRMDNAIILMDPSSYPKFVNNIHTFQKGLDLVYEIL